MNTTEKADAWAEKKVPVALRESGRVRREWSGQLRLGSVGSCRTTGGLVCLCVD